MAELKIGTENIAYEPNGSGIGTMYDYRIDLRNVSQEQRTALKAEFEAAGKNGGSTLGTMVGFGGGADVYIDGNGYAYFTSPEKAREFFEKNPALATALKKAANHDKALMSSADFDDNAKPKLEDVAKTEEEKSLAELMQKLAKDGKLSENESKIVANSVEKVGTDKTAEIAKAAGVDTPALMAKAGESLNGYQAEHENEENKKKFNN